MADIGQPPAQGNAPQGRSRTVVLAARLAAIRTEINFLHARPYEYGRNGPHRRARDEFILQVFAADIHARLVEARAA